MERAEFSEKEGQGSSLLLCSALERERDEKKKQGDKEQMGLTAVTTAVSLRRSLPL